MNTLDRYILRQTIGTLVAVLAVVMSLMTLEHLPRLVELTRYSGQASFIISHTLLGLLPEYAGIGSLFGLYLAIALTIRRLSLRGELDAIFAAGIGTARWMRVPTALSVVVMAFLFLNQGWLLPHGEQSVDRIGERMAAGEFGYKVQPLETVDLGAGRVLTFEAVTKDGQRIRNLMLFDGSKSYSSRTGTLASTGGTSFKVSMTRGQVIDAEAGTVMRFDRLTFRDDASTMASPFGSGSPERRTQVLPALVLNADAKSLAEAFARLLWPAMIPVVCAMAFYLGQAPRRSSSALALFVGLILLIGFLKSIAFVAGYSGSRPSVPALLVVSSWIAILGIISRAFVRWGPGFVDQFVFSVHKKAVRSVQSCGSGAQGSI